MTLRHRGIIRRRQLLGGLETRETALDGGMADFRPYEEEGDRPDPSPFRGAHSRNLSAETN